MGTVLDSTSQIPHRTLNACAGSPGRRAITPATQELLFAGENERECRDNLNARGWIWSRAAVKALRNLGNALLRLEPGIDAACAEERREFARLAESFQELYGDLLANAYICEHEHLRRAEAIENRRIHREFSNL